ncbi:MAG TPA: DUF1559 domain-containing protein [Isosphaeraceae bacterium]|nr:DUF1559 domain-containing protein [Isosphaeraceae bacterium]
MTETKRRRAGFTLIELLVVIAIISVLVALLLPAVQSCREAARRISCTNNLMQLSLALKNYEASHEVLPPGVVNPTGPIKNQPRGYHVSWLVQLLPFVEQRTTFNELNFSVGVYHSSNMSVRALHLSYFLCPSDSFPVVKDLGFSNYAGCHHDAEAPIADDNNGVFFLNSQIRFEDIPDGTSNTIFIGEKRLKGDLGWVSGTRSTLRNTGNLINRPTTPTAKNADPVGGFSSNHPGGVNHAFGDGSVRFLKNSIGNPVYQHLANRADGEIVNDSQY